MLSETFQPPERILRQLAFVISVAAIVCLSLPASAGPLFPCPRAVTSAHGQFLVTIATTPGIGREPGRSELSVYGREPFLNAKDRLNTEQAYYSNWARWRVVLSGAEFRSVAQCPVPLISDDGEFIVIIRLGQAGHDDQVMWIYRWDHAARPGQSSTADAIFVKAIALNQLLPAARIASADALWTDESPQWFADGSFRFSRDNRQLIYSTQSGTRIINLADGATSTIGLQEHGK